MSLKSTEPGLSIFYAADSVVYLYSLLHSELRKSQRKVYCVTVVQGQRNWYKWKPI